MYFPRALHTCLSSLVMSQRKASDFVRLVMLGAFTEQLWSRMDLSCVNVGQCIRKCSSSSIVLSGHSGQILSFGSCIVPRWLSIFRGCELNLSWVRHFLFSGFSIDKR